MSENSACRGRQCDRFFYILKRARKSQHSPMCHIGIAEHKKKKVFIIYYYECVLVIFFFRQSLQN